MDEKEQEEEQGDDLGNRGSDTGMTVQSSHSCTVVADIPQSRAILGAFTQASRLPVVKCSAPEGNWYLFAAWLRSFMQ